MKQNRANITLLVITLAIYLFSLFFATFSLRAYYADGAFWVVKIINSANYKWPLFNDSQVLRISSNIINQSVMALLIKLGVRNVYVLSVAFSLPLFFNGVLFFFLLFYMSSRDTSLLLFPVLFYSLCCMPSSIFILNPSFTAFGLYWAVLWGIIYDKDSVFKKSVFLISCVLAVFSHETYLFVGFVLLAILIFECIRKKKMDLFDSAAMMIFVVGIPYAIWFYINHKAPTKGNYFHFITNFFSIDKGMTNFWLIVIIVVIAGFGFFIKNKGYIPYVILVTGLIYTVYIQIVKKNYSPWFEYEERCLVTIGALLGIILCYLFHINFVNIKEKININYLKSITMVSLLLFSIWSIGNTVGWNGYVNEFRVMLEENNDNSFIEEYDNHNVFEWSWTPPSMSILLDESPYEITKIFVLNTCEETTVMTDENLYIPFSDLDSDIFSW